MGRTGEVEWLEGRCPDWVVGLLHSICLARHQPRRVSCGWEVLQAIAMPMSHQQRSGRYIYEMSDILRVSRLRSGMLRKHDGGGVHSDPRLAEKILECRRSEHYGSGFRQPRKAHLPTSSPCKVQTRLLIKARYVLRRPKVHQKSWRTIKVTMFGKLPVYPAMWHSRESSHSFEQIGRSESHTSRCHTTETILVSIPVLITDIMVRRKEKRPHRPIISCKSPQIQIQISLQAAYGEDLSMAKNSMLDCVPSA